MKARITNILFATALNESSCHALCHAAYLAHVTGAEIHVLHVAEPLSEDARVTLEMFMLNEGSRANATTRRRTLVQQMLERRQAEFWSAMEGHDASIRARVTSTEVIEGHPADVILRRATELGCDLLVMGAHDHGLTHTFLGTVAKRVLRRAKIPTLIVPHSDAA